MTHPVRAPRRALSRSLAASLLAASMAAATPSSAQTLVTTASGAVQGQLNDGTREFLGIPYAAPPVGSLRFAPPQPAAPWASPLDATTWPLGCSQLPVLTNSNTRIENEDCLYLNVWTPDPAPAEGRPVMVWFHGGSNVSGSNADFVPFPGYEGNRLYDGHILTRDHDVVIVTVNYRLNVFGFLGLPEIAEEDPSYPYAGNQGLLDQRAALQWVQANIAAFGGDPGNVTIFGESAGSFDVCAHVASPMSAGLFHRAISQSGGCSVGVQSAETSVAAADTLAAAVGCDAAPDRLACLRAVPTADLLDAGPLVALVGEGTNLGLSVDGGFLAEHPRDTFTKGETNRVPYLLGANFDEGTLFFIGSPELTEAEYSAELVSRFGAFAPEIEALYPATRFGTPRETLIRVFGDSSLVCSTYDTARRYSDSRGRAFAYNFSRVPPELFISALDLGAFHGLEIAYVFGTAGTPTAIDVALSGEVQSYWTAFARRGQPRVMGRLTWPRFNARGWRMMRLNSPIARLRDFRRAECEFWSGLYEQGSF